MKWVGTWATAPQLTEVENLPPPPGLARSTLRQVFRVSIGGSRLRLRLSNEYGDGPVSIEAVRVARSTGKSSIDAASDQALTFGGSSVATIEPGTHAYSDAFDFALAPLGCVAVTMRFGATPSGITGHPGSRTTSFLARGDQVSAASISGTTVDHWYYLSSLDVMADADAAAVVVLGDSITDGRGSTTNGNDRWPDGLAERLQANDSTKKIGVLNLGIGGNALVSGGLGPTAKERFESQVLGQAGVRWVIVLGGVNDIGTGAASSRAIIAELLDFVLKAHSRSVVVYGSPILPFGGSAYASAQHELERQAVNAWVRAAGHFDGVIDLDAAVRDANDLARLDPTYDCGDQLHLNPAGYRALANAVDLRLLTPSRGATVL